MVRSSSSYRVERNIKEKNRRMHMKVLLERLASLIPPQPTKLSVPEILDQATSYIIELQKKEQRLKRKKELLKGDETTESSSIILPIMNIRTLDSTLEVNLICGLNRNFMFYEIISALEEEGAEVVDATQLNAEDKVIYIIKCKAISSRIGFETARVQDRLKELVL